MRRVTLIWHALPRPYECASESWARHRTESRGFGSPPLSWLAVGVLVDYFAASSVELDRVDLSAGPAGIGWPYVDCKGWIDGLAGRVAELTGRDSASSVTMS